MTYLATNLDIYFYLFFQNTINMACGNLQMCHMSQFQTIINNHNGQWRSML
jgi:hypothetical protein